MLFSPNNRFRSGNILLSGAVLTFLEIAVISAATLCFSLNSFDRNFYVFFFSFLIFGLLGLIGSRLISFNHEFKAKEIFQLSALNLIGVILVSAFMYLALDLCGSFDAAFLEAVSGLTTTSMTGLSPETLGTSILFFRSISQWVGGFGALLLVFVALPSAGRTDEFDISFARTFTTNSLSQTLRRIAGVYGTLTLLICIGFLLAGMSFFESVCHSFSTVSTGGFSTKNSSIAGFESEAIEWVAASGMTVSGVSFIIWWWMYQKKFTSVRESSEFRVHIGLALISIAAFTFWLRNIGNFSEALRDSYFLSASLLSTTGFTSMDWAFSSGMACVVLLLLGTGAMAGSAGGGYGSGRVLQHIRFVRRELTVQYKPNAVRVVKVSGNVIDERSLLRLQGFTAIFILLVTIGAFLVSISEQGYSTLESLSLSLSALATAGPSLLGGTGSQIADFNTTGNIAVSFLMIIGRLSIFPIAYLGLSLFRTIREGPMRRLRLNRERP